jgi:hypothetical protein
MMLAEWKHQTSKLKFRGNSKLTFLTYEHRRLPDVLEKNSFRAEQSIHHHRLSFLMVALVKLHVFPPLQVQFIVGIRDPSFGTSETTLPSVKLYHIVFVGIRDVLRQRLISTETHYSRSFPWTYLRIRK